ncbi:hypothetical protein KIN20_006018 [Parelaphostrongylus tenuis]|uniref:Uncharacterized protein n=1 Tax=Parelaphostrongylus tenuis TaxID=148309 RepID=A0AAD5MMD2_PARTN|nr:hypothetical protein KIN20_006018 [Parelaphostrongylus tenuis]
MVERYHDKKLEPAAMLESKHYHRRLSREEETNEKCVGVDPLREDGPLKYPTK